THWKDMYVTLENDIGTVATSSSTNWWDNNQVDAITANNGTGRVTYSTAGKIYSVSTSANTDGYIIAEDRVAIVVRPNVTLTMNNVAVCNSNGDQGTATIKAAIC